MNEPDVAVDEALPAPRPMPHGLDPDGLTVGVEEEFLLVNARTRRVASQAPSVLAAAADRLPGLRPELTRFQLEVATATCRTAEELHRQLRTARGTLTAVAREHGLRLAATGSPVLGRVTPPPLTDHPRYEALIGQYGALADALSLCGYHVHVGMPGREYAVQVSNHLRPWLPVLLAISANSPFWDERDTGHASWRYLLWSRWPSAGPPPRFASPAHYDSAVRTLLHTGAALDAGMTYWDIRLSAVHPTIEVRVCDAPATVDEALLLALLTRALVATALAATEPAPAIPQHALRAALWRSARDGLEGMGVDAVEREVLPMRELTQRLVEHARPALEATGDLAVCTELLDAVLRRNSGAARQRRAFCRRQRLTDVVDLLTAQTAGATALT
ncbi:carboxylate-amine ligase [Gandjariella thermophila]|uniref:Putative glutamate--cysteine ligase 2 n=1 Tax=Gandjariella thermophila TaxID=1931992 RepID=A0A4D4J0Q6_9PSEU|nr:glutamate--cysteine ligase [Gandjariella thermophila]GDY28944.1 putative glutamate--cysteine ligase 2 [Gandjariella thermophila]